MTEQRSEVSVRAGVACFAVAVLAVGLGGAGGAWLMVREGFGAPVSLAAALGVVWRLAGACLSTTLSILPLAGKIRLWLPPLSLATAIGELVSRSAISPVPLGLSVVMCGFVAVAHRPGWQQARRGAALVCGAGIAAISVVHP